MSKTRAEATIEPVVRYERQADVAMVYLNHPPVNAFSLEVRRDLLTMLARAECDTQVTAVVLCGHGRGFSAGADMRELGTPNVLAAPRLALDLQSRLECLSKPVVAALHGFAVGGGLETALACHARVAAADTTIALPEVTLGIIPFSGTQRLPRVLGLELAAAMILSGRRYVAADFANSALFDRLVPNSVGPPSLNEAACELARALAAHGAPYPRVSERAVMSEGADQTLRILASARAAGSGSRAELAALEAILVATQESSFEAGLAKANAICEQLLRALPLATCTHGSAACR